MIEIISDPSTYSREAREHDPHLAKQVSRYYFRSTFWRWLGDGKLSAAKTIFRFLSKGK